MRAFIVSVNKKNKTPSNVQKKWAILIITPSYRKKSDKNYKVLFRCSKPVCLVDSNMTIEWSINDDSVEGKEDDITKKNQSVR